MHWDSMHKVTFRNLQPGELDCNLKLITKP